MYKSIGSAFVVVLLSLAISPFLSKLALRYRYSTGKNVMTPLWAIAGVLLLIMIVIGVLPQESSRVQFTVTAYKDVPINVRTAPSRDAERLGVLEIQKGETLGILEVKENEVKETWYRIETKIDGKDKVGWISKGLVVSSEPKPKAPSQEARPEPARPSPPIARTDPEPAKPPVDIARGDVDLYIDRGFIYLRKGLYNEAISDFRKACNMGDKEGCERVNQKQRAQELSKPDSQYGNGL
jgi:hypothetical protein